MLEGCPECTSLPCDAVKVSLPEPGGDGATGSTAEGHADLQAMRDLQDVVLCEIAEFRQLVAFERTQRQAQHLLLLERLGGDAAASLARNVALIKSVNSIEKHIFQSGTSPFEELQHRVCALEEGLAKSMRSDSARTCVYGKLSDEWRVRLDALSAKVSQALEEFSATVGAIEAKAHDDIATIKTKCNQVETQVYKLRCDVDGLCGDADNTKPNLSGATLHCSSALPCLLVQESALATAHTCQEGITQPSIQTCSAESDRNLAPCSVQRAASLQKHQQQQAQTQTQAAAQIQTLTHIQVQTFAPTPTPTPRQMQMQMQHQTQQQQQHQPPCYQAGCSISAPSPRLTRAPSTFQQHVLPATSPVSQNRSVQLRSPSAVRVKSLGGDVAQRNQYN